MMLQVTFLTLQGQQQVNHSQWYGKAVNDLRSAPEELELFIDDSSNDLTRDLETIRKKHLDMMSRTPTHSQTREVVKSFEFG